MLIIIHMKLIMTFCLSNPRVRVKQWKLFCLFLIRPPVTRKVLCFTPTSHIIHQYINLSYHPRMNPRPSIDYFNELFGVDYTDLYIYAITSSTTEKHMRSILSQFLMWHDTEVLIIVADMQYISKEVINHTRILMEETEITCNKSMKCSKLMILLLHFPPSSFNQYCYPLLFLHGWEHHYLDSIGQVFSDGIDVEGWLSQCFPLYLATNEDSLSVSVSSNKSFMCNEGMNNWLKDISVSTVWIHEDCSPYKLLTDTRQYWENLLSTMKVGEVIVKRFIYFWKLKQIFEVSAKAAYRSATCESTMSMSEAIQAALKDSFQDFVIYILGQISINRIQKLDRPDVYHLFMAILEMVSLPETSQQLRIESLHLLNKPFLNKNEHVGPPPLFPFLNIIYEAMESVLDNAIEYVHHENHPIVLSRDEMIFKKAKELIETSWVSHCFKSWYNNVNLS